MVNSSSGEFAARNINGDFWLSEATSTANAKRLDFYDVRIWPEAGIYKSWGYSVRCVKRIISSQLFPFSLPYSGYVNNGSGVINSQGSNSDFWINEAYSAKNASYLNYYDITINPVRNHYKTYGLSARWFLSRSSIYSHSRFRTQAT